MDLISSMQGIGKSIIFLTENPHEFKEDSTHMQRLEKLTILMYSNHCSSNTVNDARLQMFTHKLRSLDSISPTKAALCQHIKRTILIACFIWHRALTRQLNIPDPSRYGWEWNDRLKMWVPYWTYLDDARTACALMLNFGCLKSCTENCKCAKTGLRCTPLCKCQGGCTRNT